MKDCNDNLNNNLNEEIEIDSEGVTWIILRSSLDRQSIEIKRELTKINNYLRRSKDLLNNIFSEIVEVDEFIQEVNIGKCFFYFFYFYNDEYIEQIFKYYFKENNIDEYNKIKEIFNTTIRNEILRSEDIYIDGITRKNNLNRDDKIKLHIKNVKEISIQFYLLMKKTLDLFTVINDNNWQQIIIIFFPLIVHSIMN